jgi:hypothetical protein
LWMSRRRSLSSSAGSLRHQPRNRARLILSPSASAPPDTNPNARRKEGVTVSLLSPCPSAIAPGAAFSEGNRTTRAPFSEGLEKFDRRLYHYLVPADALCNALSCSRLLSPPRRACPELAEEAGARVAPEEDGFPASRE